MQSLNEVRLIGNVGKEPKIKEHGGRIVCNFSLATTRQWKDKNGEDKKETDWHTIVWWCKSQKQAELLVGQGNALHISGHIQTRNYEKDGKKVYVTEILAQNVILLVKRGDNGQAPAETGDDF